MPFYLKHLETIRLPNKVTTCFSCDISENGQISIISLNCLFIFQICAMKDSTLPVVSMKKLYIQPSQYVLSENVDLDVNTFINDLPKDILYEAVLRTDLSAKLTEGTSVESKIIKTAWSPSQLIDNYDCAIVALTNTGSLEIFIKVLDKSYFEEYTSLCNVTQKYVELCKRSWNNVVKLSPIKKYEELKYRIEQVKPTAFTWSNLIIGNSPYAILIVAHANGIISFWKIVAFKSRDLAEANVVFMNEYNTNLEYITSILWKGASDKALIFLGNKKGKTKIVQVGGVYNSEVAISGEMNLWSDEDYLKVEQITLVIYNSYLYTIVVKGTDLIIFLMNGLGQNIDNCVFHVGNLATTGLLHIGDNKLLVVSLTGATKELKLNCVHGKINIEWRHIYVNLNFYINQPLGVVCSRNYIMYAFLTGPCKIADTKDDRHLNELVMFYNTEKDPMDILLNNESKSFRNYWDCLEVLRLNSILEKQFCSKKLSSDENHDNFSLYKIKLHLWVSKIFETVFEQTGGTKDVIKSYDDNFSMLNIWMAIHRMAFLLNLHEGGATLSEFQLQNLFILNTYLKQMILENAITKLELGEMTLRDIIKVMSKANELEYPPLPICKNCGSNISDITCFPPHFDMRCAISFMQIEKFPAYKCLICKCVAHENIGKEVDYIICPICEIPMVKSLLESEEIHDKLPNIDKKPSIFCKKDCLIDVVKLSNIEEHAFVNAIDY